MAQEDLGSYERPSKFEAAKLRARLNPIAYLTHEPVLATIDRRSRNLEAIGRLEKAGAIVNLTGSSVQITINHYRFELFPSSDTWFSHAKNRFGTGIEDLISLIEKRILGR